jgi:hypothetical protein
MKNKVTLAEIEFYMRKATRAMQLDWGICEEAGKAARWLAAFNLPGPELLLRHLQVIEGRDYADLIPDCDRTVWQARGGSICPLIGGAALADRSAQMLAGGVFELANVCSPLLLAATVGQAARCHKTVFTTSWAGVSVSCHENGLSINGNRDDLLLQKVNQVACRESVKSSAQQLPSTLSYTIDSDIWGQIGTLAFKTYAPATAQSRAGAGAGLTDND